MGENKSNLDVKNVLDEMLLGLPGAKAGKMFGYEAYYVFGKMFACIYGDGVGIKVPEEEANRLLEESFVIPFQPLGRKRMREWVQINHTTASDFRGDVAVLEKSIEFVGKIAMGGKAGK